MPAAKVDLFDVTDPGRGEDNDFIAGVQERGKGFVEQRFSPAADEDLRGLVIELEVIPVISLDRFLEFEDTGSQGIMGFSSVQGCFRSSYRRGRRSEIGLTRSKRDHRFAFTL